MLLTPVGSLLAETHPFSIHDMLAMERISSARVSPDGTRLVFVLRKTDLDANRGRTDLWTVGVDGDGLRQLTTHPSSDFNPLWSHDGRSVWFLSTRSGSSQIWKIALAGGEAHQISRLPLDVGNLTVGPNGAWLAFSLDVFPDCESIECTRQRLDEEEKRPSSGRTFDDLFVRHWDVWKNGRRSHLFAMPVDGGPARDIMAGLEADAPSKPFGGTEELAFTPDSASIVFTARQGRGSEPWSTNFDLYVSPLDGSHGPRNLTQSNPAWDTEPVFSPDGKTLAYKAMKRAGFESDRFRIMLRSWPDGPTRTLTESWDRSPGGLSWAADGSTLFTSASDQGGRSLFAVDVSSGRARRILKTGTSGAPIPVGDRLVFGHTTLASPVELHSIGSDGSGLKAITRINADRVAQARLGDYEQFSFAGWNGETVSAWFVKPVDFDASKKYPLAFLIHGGPQGSFGNRFHYRWNPQAYAGAGYAAVMIDFHGSVGYGQAFTDSISGDWGGKPLFDLQRGLEETLKRYPWIDGERVGALGASYGGFMVNWIAGNWSDRFRCLVNHDGIFDNRMMYYTTEELWFPEWEHGGPYWKSKLGHEKHNPANYVDRWKTPMLVVHGALDYRVPLEQGLATFTALRRRGIPSRFLYYGDENHWVLKPQNGIQWHEEVIGWLDRWLK